MLRSDSCLACSMRPSQRGLAVPDVLIPLIIVAVGVGFFWYNEKSHEIDHPVAVVGTLKSTGCTDTSFYQWFGGGPESNNEYELPIPPPFVPHALGAVGTKPLTTPVECVGRSCDGEPSPPALPEQMMRVVERIAYPSMDACRKGPNDFATAMRTKTIWAGDNDFNNTIQARFTAERVPETKSLWITGAVLAVYFPMYFWGVRLQRADQRAKELGLPVDTGPRKSPGLEQGWRWFSHAVNFTKIFVFVSIGVFIATSLLQINYARYVDQVVPQYQWHIILLISFAWISLRRKGEDTRALWFTQLAASLGSQLTVIDEFERSFTIAVDGRDFKVTENYDSNRTTDAAGWCLYSSTTIRGARKDRSVKICKGQPLRIFGLVLPRLVSGEAVFDDHFVITDLAESVASTDDPKKSYREHMDESQNRSLAPWLNEPTRNAITAFYDLALPLQPLLIEKGALNHHVASPYEGIDGTTFNALLRRQSAVADALESGTGTCQFGLTI